MAANVSLGYLSEVERGRKEASSELLASICDALNLRLADVLDTASSAIRSDRDGIDQRVLANSGKAGLGKQAVHRPPAPAADPLPETSLRIVMPYVAVSPSVA